ncbi:MAG: GerMN domain-containing protein [Spirochaetota bacterium]
MLQKYILYALVGFFVFSLVLSFANSRQKKRVKLFFKSNKSNQLVVQHTLIPQGKSVNEKVFWILKELISGPVDPQFERIFDPTIEIQQIVVDQGIVYISFGWKLINSLHRYPSLAMGSIVDSILLNISNLDGVKILVEGIEPVNTFNNFCLSYTFFSPFQY